jgi:hypothetical protein
MALQGGALFHLRQHPCPEDHAQLEADVFALRQLLIAVSGSEIDPAEIRYDIFEIFILLIHGFSPIQDSCR